MTEPSGPSAAAVERLNSLPAGEARQALERCCGASRWVELMLLARPFASPLALLAQAAQVWSALTEADYREAFAHHPEIGADSNELRKQFRATAALAQGEQSGVADASEATLLAFRRANQAYRERFGYSFIVCASGKGALEMLAILEQRLSSAPESELHTAAAEQAKITRLRLEKIGAP